MDRNRPEIAELIEQVATATRLCVMEGLMDFSGHITARIPGEDAILIQAGKAARATLTPDEVLIVGMDGTVLSGDATPPLEVQLHLGLFHHRPDVQAILHSHLTEAVLFTLIKDTPLHVLRPAASRWKDGIPVHDYPASINTVEQSDKLALTLGSANAALLRAHGLVLCAESVKALFMDAVYFRENLQTNLAVLQTGREAVPLTDEECALIEVPRAFNVGKLWSHFSQQAMSRGIIAD